MCGRTGREGRKESLEGEGIDSEGTDRPRGAASEDGSTKSSHREAEPEGVNLPEAKAGSAKLPQVFLAEARNQGLVCRGRHLSGSAGGECQDPGAGLHTYIVRMMKEVCVCMHVRAPCRASGSGRSGSDLLKTLHCF